MDIPYHHLRTLLFCLIFAACFWFAYTLFRPDAGSALGAALASAPAAFLGAAFIYGTLHLLYGTGRMVWKRELKPYLYRKLDKTPRYIWPDTRNN